MARTYGFNEVSKANKQKGSLMNDFCMLEELTTDLIQVLNKYYPKMGCNYTDLQDELAVKHTLDKVAAMNQTNLNIIYPNRHENN